ncbi:MAG: sensor domain-containing diguanylate cyclase [Deltaproteobacteria bacterium]|nr:sensor domain-containing diguanylate cyclase [Deltaproteobacteria bacterium]
MEKQIYRKLIEDLPEAFVCIGSDYKIKIWNNAAHELFGITAEEAISTNCFDTVSHLNNAGEVVCNTDECPLKRSENQHSITGNFFISHSQGHLLPINEKCFPYSPSEGDPPGIACLMTNSEWKTDLINRLSEMEKLALIDNLTEIGNRRFGELHLKRSMDRFKRYGDPFGVLFLDIDFFKNFNDNYGHETGDNVLKMVALTLKYSLRPSDTISRWGGEEFLVIASNITYEYLENIARRVKNLINKSYINYKGKSLRITTSIGFDMAKKDDSVKDLLGRVDSFLYKSKENGRNLVTGSFGSYDR